MSAGARLLLHRDRCSCKMGVLGLDLCPPSALADKSRGLSLAALQLWRCRSLHTDTCFFNQASSVGADTVGADTDGLGDG